MQRFSTKSQQTEFNNPLKGSCTMITRNLFQGWKNESIFRKLTMLTNWRATAWSFWYMQKKAFDKVQYSFMAKLSNKVGKEGTPQHDNGCMWQVCCQHHTDCESWKPLLWFQEQRSKWTHATLIHSFGSPSHSNQTRKIKIFKIWKEEVNLSLFENDVLVYVENLWH